jgi:DNA-binding transcriptional regulator LsrR (DeoR family)
LTSETKQQHLEWRRSKVLELASKGYSQREIARKLGMNLADVNRDIQFLRKQAQQNLQKHINEVVPDEYQKCMIGMKQNLKQVLEIGEAAADPKIKLESRRIANDCYRYIMDLCTNVNIVSDALKFVTQKQEQIDTLQKSDGRIEEAIEGEERKTTSGTF